MKNKLSPLDELRLEKKRLRNECDKYEQKLYCSWEYGKENFGRLALGSIVSSVQNGIANIFSKFAGNKNNSKKEQEYSENAEQHSSSITSQMFLGVMPLVWEMIQPIVIGILTKKVKSFFSGEEKSQKKKVVKKAKTSDLD